MKSTSDAIDVMRSTWDQRFMSKEKDELAGRCEGLDEGAEEAPPAAGAGGAS
jgi:hypothetical protein